jgi:hypothetical protein
MAGPVADRYILNLNLPDFNPLRISGIPGFIRGHGGTSPFRNVAHHYIGPAPAIFPSRQKTDTGVAETNRILDSGMIAVMVFIYMLITYQLFPSRFHLLYPASERIKA